MRPILALTAALAVAGCDVAVAPAPLPQDTAPMPVVARTGGAQSLGDFRAVVARVEPVAEQVCREQTRGANCDFNIVVDTRPGQPANAYQSYDAAGRPVIAFNTALIADMRNRDELAFALSHEAAHHIEGHIAQTQTNAQAGALFGAVLGSLAGLDAQGVDVVTNLSGTVAARRYSKGFELEADSLGARIALRSGFDPLRGVLYFQDARDPGDSFLGTHPPNADRIRVVRQSVGG